MKGIGLTAMATDLVYYDNEMENRKKRLAILGSTGSIGQQTLDVVRSLPGRFEIIGLAAGENVDLLERQINEFKPKLVYSQNPKYRPVCKDQKTASLEDIASQPDVDIVVIATSGKSGLSATLSAIRANKKIALSNKESLVMAGDIITALMNQSTAQIMPVDSEHSAIWQCMNGEASKPARIILTASGGPFRQFLPARLREVTVEQALMHPSWNMGKKVTIDSATLMNKGLEVIEAHFLFEMPYERIRILIHPQSIIHSMIELVDGSFKAQLSCPDMRFPIQYALTYPERLPNPTLPELDWNTLKELKFDEPDYNAFPCLRLAIEAGKGGGTYPAVLCAADEVAVDLFLERRIKFTEIARLIELTLEKHQKIADPTLNDILWADGWAREKAGQLASGENLCQ
jgi:1-deoxy-D-xylulose-5-phosphate reductoisomerase